MLIFVFQNKKNMVLLRFLLIAVGIYYLIKILFRALFPFLMKRVLNKMQQQNHQQYQQKPDGKVTVETKTTNKNKHNTKDVGEYVDFEEIDN